MNQSQVLIEAMTRSLTIDGGDPRTRFESLTKILEGLGIDEVNYGYFDPSADSAENADVLFVSNMDPTWLQHYNDTQLFLTDPHVHFVKQGNLLPYLWGEKSIHTLSDPKMRETVKQTAEAGIRSGFFVPMAARRGPMSPVAAMTMGSHLSSPELKKNIGGLEAVLMASAYMYHERSHSTVLREALGMAPLSPREVDCLSLLAAGHRPDRISARLNLARVTVDMHLRNARQKLKARNMPQAIATAIRFDLIQLDWKPF